MLVRDVQPGAMRVVVRRGEWTRVVSVLTDHGPLFPHPLKDTGESTGDAELDQAVRAYVQQQLAARAADRPRPRTGRS